MESGTNALHCLQHANTVLQCLKNKAEVAAYHRAVNAGGPNIASSHMSLQETAAAQRRQTHKSGTCCMYQYKIALMKQRGSAPAHRSTVCTQAPATAHARDVHR